jgi:quercetin dioxygenase-like cupin family protein
MGFFNWRQVALQEFRPGIRSYAVLGEQVVLAVMEIAPGFEDPGHAHPGEQCGLVLEGEVEMDIAGEGTRLGVGDGYFIPVQAHHRFRVGNVPAKVLDTTVKA